MAAHVQRQQFSVWDNFARQKKLLEGAGAKPDQIERLRASAQAVEDAESAAQAVGAAIHDVTEPLVCANGWTVNPPTKAARYFATLAGATACGGVTPETRIGEMMVIVAGLWALWQCGDGHAAVVQQALARRDGIGDVVAEQMSGLGLQLADKLGEDYAKLMGFTMPPSAGAAEARRKYEGLFQEISKGLRGGSAPRRRGRRS